MIVRNPNGITVRQLKDFVADMREENENGEEAEVWIGDGQGHSNIAVIISTLNESQDGSDLLLEPGSA